MSPKYILRTDLLNIQRHEENCMSAKEKEEQEAKKECMC